MSKQPRKTLGDWQEPHFQSLMRLIETQSKVTLVNWCLDYTEEFILPIYEKTHQNDRRPRSALDAARDWLDGKVKLPVVRKIILEDCHGAARDINASLAASTSVSASDIARLCAAQAAARTCGQAAACIHSPAHSLGLAFYGAAAIAYDRVGIDEAPEVYAQISVEECGKMEAALRAVAVKNEPNPAKINWKC